MNYFIQEFQTDAGVQKTAGIKARDDVDAILADMGMNRISLSSFEEERTNGGLLKKLCGHLTVLNIWKKQLKRLCPGDKLFVQFPVLGHSVFLSGLFQSCEKRGVQIILLIHDLELLRWAKRKYISVLKKIRLRIEEKSILSCCSRIIVHNLKMKEMLCQTGISGDKVISLDIFDYLVPEYNPRKINAAQRDKGGPVIIAGALAPHKARYIYRLSGELRVNLYGVKYSGEVNERIRYFGAFPPDELPYAMEGSFGLVWDGESIETCSGVYGEYLRINNPHKTSLYLASGLPVIIWSQAALAGFVTENRCGIAVDSILDIEQRLASMTEEEYTQLKEQAAKVGERLRSGYYTRRAAAVCLGWSKM